MKQLLKHISFVMIALFFVACIPTTVHAEEETKVAINVQIPEGWENPSIWAWDEDGNNAFESWPGGEMEVNSSEEGWYYVWIPEWATHVIVNANEGTVQTDELILDGVDTWITITEDATDISYEQMTQEETPAYVEKFVVHAQVDETWEDASIWAWSAPDGTNAFETWPGKAMTEGEDGWFSVKVPIWVNSIIINANEGTVQTEDITIDPAEIWITILADGTYELSYTDPMQEDIADVSVNVMVPEEWESACLWAWSAPDGTNVYTTWPGEPLLEGEEGWLTLEIPGWVNSIIVNANEGTIQTSDISVDTGKNIWVVVKDAEDYEVYYEAPEIATEEVSEVEEVEDVVEVTEVEESSNSIIIVYVVLAIVFVAILVSVIVLISKKKKK